ncbi:glutamate-1-semialdehyde 2,1-aminomutase [bacterium AH-315-C07]|nr:glutamate-1-semialdehyde 2,1-aminomutase [bacterium AH-315-C07]
MNSYVKRLNSLIPGGAHTYSRGHDQYPDNAPSILARGEGTYVYDPNGTKYLDYGMALMAITVGYNNKEISQAAIDQIGNGNNLPKPSMIELEAAEKIIDLIPSAEMVKFAKNGSTTTTAAIKLSRAYTGRKYIARCTDHPFFSYDDWFIGSTVVTKGIQEEVQKLTLSFKYNNIGSLEDLFNNYPSQIAAVILEPATWDEPKEGFLEKIKVLCNKNGTVYILDEMRTGFRWDVKGAQYCYNVEPDLSTFGKGIANGFSVAALVGKKEIMDLGGIMDEGSERIFLISTTHGAEMCGLGALIKTIELFQKHNITDHYRVIGNRLRTKMNEIITGNDLEDYFELIGPDWQLNYITRDQDGKISMAYRTLFMQEMVKKHILMSYIAFCYCHTNNEIDLTLEAFDSACKVYKQALGLGLDKFLHSNIIKPVFRKHN